MSGFITVERDIWDHPVFKPSEMSEREAWMWMLARAAWAETRHRAGNVIVNVPRGSFVTTLREMQSAFMWKSDKRVRSFLDRLETHAMIGRTVVGQTNAPKTHVTICNYDKYQTSGRTKDAPRTHRGRTEDAVKEQDKQETKEDTNVSLSRVLDHQPIDEVAEAVHIYRAAAADKGWPVPQQLDQPRRRAISARLRDAGGVQGWGIAISKAAGSDFLGQARPFSGFGIDWIAKPANFKKIMEGNYDGKPASQDRRAAAKSDAVRDTIDAAASYRRTSPANWV